MANHVTSYIEFIEINDEAKAKLVELSKRLRPMNYGQSWFADLFVEGELNYEDVEQYAWTTEHIGPKWCHIDDYDFEGETPFMSTQSAWSPPIDGLTKLLEVLEELDPKLVTSIRYEDEMPNFIGWNIFVGSEIEDGCEDDDEDIRNYMFNKYPNLKEQWDFDNEDWMCDEDGDYTPEAEEAEEEYRDLLYQEISEMNDEGVEGALESIMANREE
jgi:hypothetical protein